MTTRATSPPRELVSVMTTTSGVTVEVHLVGESVELTVPAVRVGGRSSCRVALTLPEGAEVARMLLAAVATCDPPRVW